MPAPTRVRGTRAACGAAPPRPPARAATVPRSMPAGARPSSGRGTPGPASETAAPVSRPVQSIDDRPGRVHERTGRSCSSDAHSDGSRGGTSSACGGCGPAWRTEPETADRPAIGHRHGRGTPACHPRDGMHAALRSRRREPSRARARWPNPDAPAVSSCCRQSCPTPPARTGAAARNQSNRAPMDAVIEPSRVSSDIPRHFYRDAPQDPHQRRRHQAVLSLLHELPPGRVLDYGFGWGDIAWAASRTHPDIHAVDVEQRRVEFARQQYAPIPFDRCRPDGVDFADASFDIVLSIVVLPFVPDDEAYVAELRRVLRPGGHLVIATKTSQFLPRVWMRLSGQRERDRNPAPGIRHHDAADAAALLGRHGFTIL